MRLEIDLEEGCCEIIAALKGQALKLMLRGVRGFPDRTILMPGGKIWFAEFKRESRDGKISAQQRWWERILKGLGFGFYYIDNIEDFNSALATEVGPPPVPGSLDRLPVQPQQRTRSSTRRSR